MVGSKKEPKSEFRVNFQQEFKSFWKRFYFEIAVQKIFLHILL